MMLLSISAQVDATTTISARPGDGVTPEAALYLSTGTTTRIGLYFSTEGDLRRFHAAVVALLPPGRPDEGPHGVVIPDSPR